MSVIYSEVVWVVGAAAEQYQVCINQPESRWTDIKLHADIRFTPTGSLNKVSNTDLSADCVEEQHLCGSDTAASQKTGSKHTGSTKVCVEHPDMKMLSLK